MDTLESGYDKKVLPAGIAYTASRFPQHIAIEEHGRKINYAQLMVRANRLAAYLHGQLVAGGEPVGVYLPAGITYITSIVGINIAGALFMPLDIDYPEYRLGQMLRDVGQRLLVTDSIRLDALAAMLDHWHRMSPGDADRVCFRVIVVDAARGLLSVTHWDNGRMATPESVDVPAMAPPVELSGEESNYLLFTSGSTGTPKAIEGCHKSLSHFIHWEIAEFGLEPGMRVSQLAPLLFDVSLRDIFVPLLCGGTVVVPPENVKRQPEKLAAWIESSGINLVHTVPSLFRIMTEWVRKQGQEGFSFSSLRYILLAGEPLYGRDVDEWHRLTHAAVTLVNLYGPSETTLAKLFLRIDPGAYGSADVVPLGEPISNTRVLILKNGRLCEIGEAGEIHIKTPFVSRGYFRDPKLTASRFIQNPLHNDYPDIIYRTGDIGRYDKQRRVEYIGREDSLVKIRGNRVELSEVDKAVRGYAGVSQAVVTVVKDASDETRIACYLLEADALDLGSLRAHLKELLPEYMIPSYFTVLPEFPLQINGKVNKHLLPRPEDLLYERSAYTAPRNETEERLAAIWAEVLKLKKVGVLHSFFELGGHSLSATRVVARISQEFGKELSLKQFLDHPTIDKLALSLDGIGRQEIADIPHYPAADWYPVSSAQRRLWVMDQMEDSLLSYNIQAAYRLTGPLQPELLRKAFAVVHSRHDILRTVFQTNGNEPVQIVLPEEEIPAPFFTPGVAAGTDGEAEVRRLLREEANMPFDLARGPLYRVVLLSLEDDVRILCFTIHHIIADAWSLNILFREVLLCYRAFAEGLAPMLDEQTIQYKDYSIWHNGRVDNMAVDEYLSGLRAFLADGSPRLAAGDLGMGTRASDSGRTFNLRFPDDVKAALYRMAAESATSPFMNLLAAVGILLYRYTGEQRIALGTAFSGREHPALAGVAGFFVNILPVYALVDREQLIGDVIGTMRQRLLGMHAIQSYPFDRIVNSVGYGSGSGRRPLFDVFVEFQATESFGSAISGIGVSRIQQPEEYCHFGLSFRFEQMGDELFLALNYSTELFSDAYVIAIAEDLMRVIDTMIADRLSQVGNIPLGTAVAPGVPARMEMNFDFL